MVIYEIADRLTRVLLRPGLSGGFFLAADKIGMSDEKPHSILCLSDGSGCFLGVQAEY